MADENSIYCPNCRSYSALSKRAEFKKREFVHEIGECNNCDFVLLARRRITSGVIEEVCPRPFPKPIDKKTPEFLKKDLEEAYLSFSIGAYRGAGVLARRALQLACIEKGAPDKRLNEQIDWLLEKQVVTKDLNKWAHEVRLTGNDAAHPPKEIKNNIPVTEEDAEDILTLLEKFIEVLYIAPALAEERRKKRSAN